MVAPTIAPTVFHEYTFADDDGASVSSIASILTASGKVAPIKIVAGSRTEIASTILPLSPTESRIVSGSSS